MLNVEAQRRLTRPLGRGGGRVKGPMQRPVGRHHTMSLRGNFDVLHLTRRRRNRQTVLAKAFDVKDNGFAYFCFNFRNCGACGNTTRKVRHICRVVALGLLNNDCVAHMISLQASLLQDAVQRTGRKIVARFARGRDAAGLARVLELPVTAARGYQAPAIALKHTKNLSDLHDRRIAGRVSRHSTSKVSRPQARGRTWIVNGGLKLRNIKNSAAPAVGCTALLGFILVSQRLEALIEFEYRPIRLHITHGNWSVEADPCESAAT